MTSKTQTHSASSIHAAMLSEADRLGLPHHFPTDLLRDQQALCALSAVPAVFGWVLYDDGTHLVNPTAGKRDRMQRWCEAIRDEFSGQHYYLLTETTELREVCFDDFAAALVAAAKH